ncbi:hypothetical protein AK812_SmicGene10326 [Symbiodinium microadriaticum]|uniref:Uncharacterized protein n=1 Tax=Symbiodinium microadriaticum TaxID=2951 RepID=A0A1Q9EG17_SYMMI|nr:hypothetical protein AK812_SmicGene10326 [Symbiodinium microadriaticum]
MNSATKDAQVVDEIAQLLDQCKPEELNEILASIESSGSAIDETGVDLEYARIADALKLLRFWRGKATVGAAMALFASCRGVPKALQNDPVEDSD